MKSNCIGSWRCPGGPRPKASYRNPSKDGRPYSSYLGNLLPDFPLSVNISSKISPGPLGCVGGLNASVSPRDQRSHRSLPSASHGRNLQKCLIQGSICYEPVTQRPPSPFSQDPCILPSHPLGCLIPNQFPSKLHDLHRFAAVESPSCAWPPFL